jgi:hypothetical protein
MKGKSAWADLDVDMFEAYTLDIEQPISLP